MKHKKSLLTIILVAILLTSAVSGTIAYLKTSTGTVTNQFNPTEVTSEIVEEGWSDNGTQKSSVVVKNTGSTSAYIRAAVVGNWCNGAGEIVEPWNGTITPSENWSNGSDGYYYYTKVVPVGQTTTNLLSSPITTETRTDGTHLVVTVVQQAIQAEGMGSDGKNPVEQMWGVTVNDNGTSNNYSDDTIGAN